MLLGGNNAWSVSHTRPTGGSLIVYSNKPISMESLQQDIPLHARSTSGLWLECNPNFVQATCAIPWGQSYIQRPHGHMIKERTPIPFCSTRRALGPNCSAIFLAFAKGVTGSAYKFVEKYGPNKTS